MNLKEIKCARLGHHLNERVRVQRLSRWGCEFEIYLAPETLYFPEYLFQVWNGFAPEEAVNYEPHLGIAQQRVPEERTYFEIEDAERCDLEVCILANPCTRTFGHWTEELLKVLILEEAGFRGQYVLPPSPQTIWSDSLALLGIGQERIIIVERPVVFASAAFTTLVHHFVAHRFPGLFRALRDQLHVATGQMGGMGDRIWITRGAVARRNHGDVLNQDEVHGIARHYGFVPVDFGRLTFAQQIGVDRDARIVAGPHGSAFVHVGFMRDRAAVLEIFSPHYINPSVIQLCQALSHNYHQMVPVNTPYQPYNHPGILIDTDHLRLILDELCGRVDRPIKSGSAV